MSWVEQMQAVYAHSEWANGRILEAAAKVSKDDLAAMRPGTSYGTVLNDLFHIGRVQLSWHSVAAEIPFVMPPPLPEQGFWPGLRKLFDDSHAALRDLMSTLTEERLDASVRASWQGKEYTFVRWHVLQHLANHGTQHRGEIGMALYGLGANPGDLDFIDHVRGEVS